MQACPFTINSLNFGSAAATGAAEATTAAAATWTANATAAAAAAGAVQVNSRSCSPGFWKLVWVQQWPRTLSIIAQLCVCLCHNAETVPLIHVTECNGMNELLVVTCSQNIQNH